MDNKPLVVDPVSASFGARASAIAMIVFTFYASAMVAAFSFLGKTKGKADDERK
jgi:hypothetical protein